MIFELVSSKVHYVQNRLKGLQLGALKAEVQQLCGQTAPSDTLQEMLSVEMLYLLEKHKRWRHLPLFQELAQEYFAASYRLTPADFATLWTSFQKYSPDLGWPSTRSEDDFFVWLIATSALADGGSKLILELGLGRQIIARLKRAAAQVFLPSAEKQATFLSELDEKLLAVTSRLTREAKRLPWSLELHRLRYTLDRLPEPWQTMVDEADVSFIHQILVFIGKTSGAKEIEILRETNSLIDGIRELPNLESIFHALLAHLKTQGFIHVLASGPANLRKWQLTELGERSSSHLFAASWQNSGKDRDALLRLNESYQVAALEREDLTDLASRCFYLDHLCDLKPRSLRFVIHRLKRLEGPLDLAEDLLSAFDAAQVPWRKQVIVECLGDFRDLPRVRHFLTDVAQSDPSTLVRKTAETMLLQNLAGCPATGQKMKVSHDEGQR